MEEQRLDRSGRVLAAALAGLALSACEREERVMRRDPPVVAALDEAALLPGGVGGAEPLAHVALGKPYETNAYEIAQGKRLYAAMNCAGCHGDGSGGVGPSLIDGWWAYGADLPSLYATIRDGRPRGMPPYRQKLPPDSIWQLAGYVQTLASYSAKTAAPGRDDAPQTRPAENRAPATQAPLEPPAR
ncbi:cytochrome c oxidase subunit III [Methylopila sp. Yamaguchi]|nr:cytochrome c oxidase subunit III [Methylopila sp. Yamaguchi]